MVMVNMAVNVVAVAYLLLVLLLLFTVLNDLLTHDLMLFSANEEVLLGQRPLVQLPACRVLPFGKQLLATLLHRGPAVLWWRCMVSIRIGRRSAEIVWWRAKVGGAGYC